MCRTLPRGELRSSLGPVHMTHEPYLRGDLQTALMRVLWDDGPGTVEELRSRLPEAHRRAFNTVQTVLNRLAKRGLVRRERGPKPAQYSASIPEADYVSASIRRTLNSASAAARTAALAEIVDSLEVTELRELKQRKN